MTGTDLAAMTWPEIRGGMTVLVPAGSTEQHGPHLPLDTDTVIAVAVAQAAAQTAAHESGSTVVVAPALAYGASGEHQHFPGTVSVGHEALSVVLVELVRSLSVWAQRIIFVNAHGGNVRALAGSVTRLRREGHTVGWVPCLPASADAHAGRTETSLMLHLAPESVRISRAVRGNTAPVAELMADMAAGGVRSVSATGVLGDPAGASSEEGALLLADSVRSVLSRIAGNADRHGCLQPAGAVL